MNIGSLALLKDLKTPIFFSMAGNPRQRLTSTGRISYCLCLSALIIHSNQLYMLRYRLQFNRFSVEPWIPVSDKLSGDVAGPWTTLLKSKAWIKGLSLDAYWDHLGALIIILKKHPSISRGARLFSLGSSLGIEFLKLPRWS